MAALFLCPLVFELTQNPTGSEFIQAGDSTDPRNTLKAIPAFFCNAHGINLPPTNLHG
jgi:hypothetical protein